MVSTTFTHIQGILVVNAQYSIRNIILDNHNVYLYVGVHHTLNNNHHIIDPLGAMKYYIRHLVANCRTTP